MMQVLLEQQRLPSRGWVMNNKILILDDEDPIRQFMKINLDYQGYQTVEASSGEEALKVFDEEKPAVEFLISCCLV